MEPIIFERSDVRELAAEMIKCCAWAGIDISGHIVANWAHFGPAVIYVNSCCDNDFICPSRVIHRAGDYIDTRRSFLQRITENAIAAVLHEMHENCSVVPVCYSENDEFQLREIEEMHAACEYIKNANYQFLIDRAYELGVDAVHMHNDYIDGLQVVINGTDRYKVEFRVMYGNVIMGEIN